MTWVAHVKASMVQEEMPWRKIPHNLKNSILGSQDWMDYQLAVFSCRLWESRGTS
jgi:hypothetical protein